MATCHRCGRHTTGPGCVACGLPARHGLATRARAVPPLLWVVVGMLTVVGGFVAWLFQGVLRSAVALFSFGAVFGIVALLLALLLGATAVLYLAVAGSLLAGSRVGRGVAYVLAGDILLTAIASQQRGPGIVLVALGAVAVAGMLALVPSVRSYFTGPFARSTTLPSSVVAGHVLVVLWGTYTALAALIFFVGGSRSAELILAGLLCLGLAGLAFWSLRGLAAGNRAVRLALSVAAVADLVAVLVAGNDAAGLVFALGMHLGLIAILWLPDDTRAHFGDHSLHTEAMRRRVQEMLTPSNPASPAPHSGTDAAAAPATGPLAGWYPDPSGGGHRYWDGHRWTPHTM